MRWYRLSRSEFSARLVAIRKSHVVNLALGTYSSRARYTRKKTSCAKSSACSRFRTIRYRKFTKGLL